MQVSKVTPYQSDISPTRADVKAAQRKVVNANERVFQARQALERALKYQAEAEEHWREVAGISVARQIASMGAGS